MGKIELLHLICATSGLRAGGIPQGHVIKVVEFITGRKKKYSTGGRRCLKQWPTNVGLRKGTFWFKSPPGVPQG